MRLRRVGLLWSLAAIVCSTNLTALAQDSTAAASTTTSSTATAVPSLINYTGYLKDSTGKPLTGITGVTFLLYQEESGGSPTWIETQNVTPDKTGKYTVTLGAAKLDSSLADSFSSGGARWLGVQASGQTELPRVLLVSVPYAMKAADADTIGGLPASAFMLANGQNGAASANTASSKSSISNAASSKNSTPANPNVTGKGVVDYIPMWDTVSDIVDSVMFQKSSQIGIGTITPAATLDVNGKSDVRDTLTLFPKSTDNTLAVSGTNFKISSTGSVTFITGQKFPGAGTVTSVGSGSGLTGGPITSTGTLSIKTAGVTNAMLQNSKITLNGNTAGGLTTPGGMTLGSTYTIGLKPCSANQVLQYNGTTWNCAAVGTGTVTSVGSGAGLTGGPITGAGTLSIANAGVTNAMLQNSAVTVAAGTDLTGGGAATLGGSAITLNLDTTKVPALAGANAFTNSDSFSGTPSGPEVQVNNNGSGDGIDVFSAASDGVYSQTGGFDGGDFISFGTGYGSFAEAIADAKFATAAAGWQFGASQENIGVWGFAASPIGIGNYSESYAASAEGIRCCAGSYTIGSWSDTSGNSGTQAGIAALTTVDNGYSIVSYSNSVLPTVWLENDENSSSSALVLITDGGTYGGQCYADVSGNLTCTGTITPAAPLENGNKVAMYNIAAAENWFEDAGGGQLANGSAIVQLDATFAQTVNTSVDYRVFLTPNGDCKGLYVSQKSATSFEVHELGGGSSNISFDYRIMAKRRGFESVRLADRSENLVGKRPNSAGTRGPNPDEARKAHTERVDQMKKAAAAARAKAVAVTPASFSTIKTLKK